ncbi:MAG: TatD family hydrolase [Patescibacteria group bacterium]
MNCIDIHGHVNFPDYTDVEGAIERARAAGVGMVTVGTGLASSQQAIVLAEAHENMWATVGIHPTDTDETFDTEVLETFALHPKVVAIGECGLDYFHSTPEEIPRQREIFIQHIMLANKVNKPLMLHIRNGKKGGNAYQEAISILKEHSRVRANFHFFAGTVEDAQAIVAMGNTVSFTGVLTFTQDYDEVVRSVPLTHIMSETDCPFVSPTPYRGTQNEPAHVREVVRAIARIRSEDEGAVAKQIIENAREFFGINP